jgi:hypothetical protein
MKKINQRLFWQRVRKLDYCWFWTGPVNRGGYGIHGTILAHRASWLITRGDIPERLKILHSCDNRRCVNPNHMRLGTQMQNVTDMHDRNRANKARGEANAVAKLSVECVIEIRRRSASGEMKTEIARKFGVTPTCIGSICKRKTWAHVE